MRTQNILSIIVALFLATSLAYAQSEPYLLMPDQFEQPIALDQIVKVQIEAPDTAQEKIDAKWLLDPEVHHGKDSETFFHTDTEYHKLELILLPNNVRKPGEYHLIWDGKISKVIDPEDPEPKEETFEFKIPIIIRLKHPSAGVTMSVNDPKTHKKGLEPFTINLHNINEQKVDFKLEYSNTANPRLIFVAESSLDSGSHHGIDVVLPLPKKDTPFVFRLTYTVDGGAEATNHIVVRVGAGSDPSISQLGQRLAEIKGLGVDELVPRLMEVMALTQSVFTHGLKSHLPNTDMHEMACDEHYCNRQGQCRQTRDYLLHCDCTSPFEGPTCAFADLEEEKQVIQALTTVVDIVDKVETRPKSMIQVSEILAAIATYRELFNFDLLKRVVVSTQHVINHMGQNYVNRDIVKDILLIEQGILVNGLARFYGKKDLQAEDSYNAIRDMRNRLHQFYPVVLKSIRHYTDSKTYRIITGTASLAIKVIEPAKFQGVQVAMEIARKTRVAETEEDDGQSSQGWELEHAHVSFPIAVLKGFGGGEDAKYGIVAYESFHNPYETMMHQDHHIISNTFQVKVYNMTTEQIIHIPESGIDMNMSLHIPIQTRLNFKFENEECVWWDHDKKSWNTNGCKGYSTKTSKHHECNCHHVSDFGLLIGPKEVLPVDPDKPTPVDPTKKPDPKPDPTNPDPTKKDPTDPVKPDPTKPDPTKPDPKEPVRDRGFRLPQILLSVVIIAVLWSLWIITVAKAGYPNAHFDENHTLHPLYSIIFVNNGSLPRYLRLHLYFATIVIHMLVVTYVQGYLAIPVALVVTPVPNYIFGALGKLMGGGDKHNTRTMFAVVLELVIVGSLIATHHELSVTGKDLVDLVRWVIILVIDILVLDTAFAKIALKVTALKAVLKLRGFYFSPNDMERSMIVDPSTIKAAAKDASNTSTSGINVSTLHADDPSAKA